MNSSLRKKLNSRKYEEAIAEATERQAHESASKTASYAPRKTGALANSFPASVNEVSKTEWEYGSELPYATIQEFTNRNHPAFVRKTIQEDTPAYNEKLKAAIKRTSKS